MQLISNMSILQSRAANSSQPGSSEAALAAKRNALANLHIQATPWQDKENHIDHDGVSPISDRSPPRPGTKWTKFFPELSPHFSLVSPVSTTENVAPYSLNQALLTYQPKRFYSTDSAEDGTESSPTSNEIPDSTSSCYSRRSSITSIGSEPSGGAYQSADAFSIISPTSAGVFDDSASMRRAPSCALGKPFSPIVTTDKPLPREPAIQLAPLLIRRSSRQSPQDSRKKTKDYMASVAGTGLPNRRRGHQPTLSQAQQELENALAGITEQQEPPEESLDLLSAPLQISRGNMDMVPSRPPPAVPIGTQAHSPPGDVPHRQGRAPKKAHIPKLSIPFSLPGLNRKFNRIHIRSRSSPDILESPILQSPEELKSGGRNNVLDLEAHLPSPRPVSADGEKDSRSKILRVQTEPVSQSSSPFHEEKIFVSSNKSRQSYPAPSRCEIELIQSAPEIVYELDSGCAAPRVEPPPSVQLYSGTMPTGMPDGVLLALFKQVGSLDDLFHLATVSRQFYHVFKAHELELIKRTVFTMSPPAWELREMSPPWDSEWQILVDPDAPVPEYTPANYLQRYAQDIYTLAQLKSLILARCGTFLRPETVQGLAGLDDARAVEVDDAFWRIWTFCRIFGSGKNREGDIVGQMDWLNGGVMARNSQKSDSVSLTEPFGMNNVLFEPPAGFAQGNRGGLSQKQLYDLTEIWTCLSVLLQPIHGRCSDAREMGIFQGHINSPDNNAAEESLLEEWTFYILSLGPSAVLNLGSICPADNGLATFQRAKLIGLTKWEQSESGISRSSFLKDAVSKAYTARQLPARYKPSRSSDVSSRSSSSSASDTGSRTSSDSSRSGISIQGQRRRQAAYAEQLRNRRRQQPPAPTSQNTFADERPISHYGTIMHRLAGLPKENSPPIPVTSPTTLMTPPGVANFVIPEFRRPPPQKVQPVQPSPPNIPVYRPQVLDPVDRALEMIVGELGFQAEDAKWALKVTDNGEGINPDAAVALLMKEQKRTSGQVSMLSGCSTNSGRSSLVSSVIGSQESMSSGWRWA